MSLGTPFGKVFGIKSILSFLHSVKSKLIDYIVADEEPKELFDYEEEKYFVKGKESAFADALEHTATTNGTMVDSDGILKWRPHNLLTDTVGLSTNWDRASQGTGSLPTITRDYAAAPDGTMTAARLQCSRTSTSSGDRSYFRQTSIPTVIGSDVTQALWVKSTDGTPQTIQLLNNQENNAKLTETVGSSWQRISLEYPILLSTSGQFWIGLVGAETSDLAADVLIWHPHLYRSDLGGMASDPDQPAGFETEVPTSGSSVVYLPRRGHHIYNGAVWVNEGLLIEPSTQTNKPHSSYSAPKNGTTDTIGVTISDDAGVGFTGAGTGPRVTGSGSAGIQRINLGNGDATYRSTAQVYISKSSTHKYYQILSSLSSNAYANFDITDGSIGSVGSSWSADGIVNIVEHETFYELVVNDTQLTTGPRYLYFVDSKTEGYAPSSATSDYADIPYIGNIHQSGADNTYPALPIICTGSQVSRAGEQLVLPHENISWPEPKVIGPELVTNGTFDTDLTGWIASGNWAWSNGGAQHTSSGSGENLSQIVFQAGKVYQIQWAQDGDFVAVYGDGVSTLLSNTSGTIDKSIIFVSASGGKLTFRAASGTVTIDNISVREIEPLALSIQMQGSMTYADTDIINESVFVRWTPNGSDGIVLGIDTDGTDTGQFKAYQSAFGVDYRAETAGDYFSPAVNVPFNVASRHGSTFINGAVDGTALTVNTTPTAIPDLKTADLQLAYSGGSMVINLFRMWDVDIGDAGTEDATKDISGVLDKSGNWNDIGIWSGSENFDGTSGADLQVEINNWLMTQDTIDSRLDALEEATEDISGALDESGNWNDAGAWSGSEDFDGKSGAELQADINNWLMTQDTIDSRLDALEE